MITLFLCAIVAHFYFVTHMPMHVDPSDRKNVMRFCRVDESVNPTPKPIFGLPCHDTCEDGEYATVNWQKHEPVYWCDQCPKNTYSVGGGGILIDGTMGAFSFEGDDGNAMPLRMEPSCLVHTDDGNKKQYKNDDCTPWTRTGTSLKAYQADIDDKLVDFDLTYPVYFDEEGKVEFKYRKDTIGDKTSSLGIFKFIIDEKVQLIDDDMFADDWQMYSLDQIPKGFHNLVWRYTKYNSIPFTEFMEAEIESITVRGRHSNHLTQCYPCNLGHSKPGSGRCELCPANSYFFINEENSDFYCGKCDKGKYSSMGSVGKESCQGRRPCDEGDMDLIGSACVDGIREVKYEWSDIDGDGELDCDPDHPDSIITKLPEKRSEPCMHCSQGMSKDEHGNCKYCNFGTF